MTITLQHWPPQALDIAAELRRQLDEARAELANLCATLLGEAELAEAQQEPHETRGSAWWYAAWREVSRHRSELQTRVGQLERWLRESGAEATRLQTELTAARAANDELTRRIAESEGDFAEMFADREEALGKLARCECEHEVH